MSLLHPSYTLSTANPPRIIDGIKFSEYRTQPGRYIWISECGMMGVLLRSSAGKTWMGRRYSNITKMSLIVGSQFRSMEAAAKAAISAAYGHSRR